MRGPGLRDRLRPFFLPLFTNVLEEVFSEVRVLSTHLDLGALATASDVRGGIPG